MPTAVARSSRVAKHVSEFARVLPGLPGVFRFVSSLAGPRHPVNSYLVETRFGPVLIDPAKDVTPESIEAIRPGLSERVTHILLTHLQAENADGCENFPWARVHAAAGDEYLAHGPQAYHALDITWQAPWDWGSRGNYRGHIGGARNERPPEHPLRLAEPLAEPDSMFDLKFVPTPGHGKHAFTIVLELAGKKIAFCGDVICGDGKLWNWFDSEWTYGTMAGYHTLKASAEKLIAMKPDVLLPTHGPVIRKPVAALTKLVERMNTVLGGVEMPKFTGPSTEWPATAGPTDGWFQLSPHLYQWRQGMGNCAAVVTDDGHALFIDDGLCQWIELSARTARHKQVITDFKKALGIKRVEIVIPTHYHGDHLENIPELVEMDGTRVVCLDTVADVIEHPEKYDGLACPLPWYGAVHQRVKVNERVKSEHRFTWRGYQFEIFHLGGQTYYHAGITATIDGRRVMFVGDSVNGGLGVEPVLCYNDNEPTKRGWAYAIDVALRHKPDAIVCGHGYAYQNIVPALRHKKEAWRRRIAQFKQLSLRKDLRAFFDPFV